jgi:hypothetical protein
MRVRRIVKILLQYIECTVYGNEACNNINAEINPRRISLTFNVNQLKGLKEVTALKYHYNIDLSSHPTDIIYSFPFYQQYTSFLTHF